MARSPAALALCDFDLVNCCGNLISNRFNAWLPRPDGRHEYHPSMERNLTPTTFHRVYGSQFSRGQFPDDILFGKKQGFRQSQRIHFGRLDKRHAGDFPEN